MAIISLEGTMGSGKSTAAVALGVEDAQETGRKIISNMHINAENYSHFDLKFFIDHIADHELEDCVLILDEMYQLFDSRSSGTKLNKLLTYFFVQTRKRGVDLYICTHHLDHIDKRGRRAVDIRGACRFYPEKPCKKCHGAKEYKGQPCDRCLGYGESGWVVVNFLDRRIRRRYSREFFGPAYWHLFATKERIPIQARMIQGIDLAEVV